MKAISPAISAIIVALACISPIFPQEGEGAVFAPYPSRIRVGVRSREVVITWEDSPDVSSGYAVSRHSEFPGASNFGKAMLLGFSDRGGVEYVYEPIDEKPYYYFVLGRVAENEATAGETEYRLFIPLRNVPIEAVAVSFQTPSVPSTVKAADKAPRLSGIIARAEADAIIVSIDASRDVGRLVVYRGTAPLKSSSSLLDAVLAAIIEPDSGPYHDFPVPGVDYYYAVIPERDFIGGRVILEAGVNATLVPVSIQAGTYRIGLPMAGATSRNMPLPFLVLTRGFEDAKPMGVDDPTPRSRTLSAETEKAIATLGSTFGSASKAKRPPITIFPEDLQSGGGGEEYALRSIVTNFLAKGNHTEAARQLTLYLSLPRSPANAGKARFYRGQAQAMAGAWRESFFDLLQAQDPYYLESSAWIDYILEELRRR